MFILAQSDADDGEITCVFRQSVLLIEPKEAFIYRILLRASKPLGIRCLDEKCRSVSSTCRNPTMFCLRPWSIRPLYSCTQFVQVISFHNDAEVTVQVLDDADEPDRRTAAAGR